MFARGTSYRRSRAPLAEAARRCFYAKASPSSAWTMAMTACRLRSRGVVRFEGDDSITFLNGLLTNDLSPLRNPHDRSQQTLPTPNQPAVLQSTGPLYAAALAPEGRFLFDLFLFRPIAPQLCLDSTGSAPAPPSDTPLFADVDLQTLDEFLAHLKKYRLRSKVEMFDVSKDIAVWQCFSHAPEDKTMNQDSDSGSIGLGAAGDAAGKAASEGNSNHWRWYKDPRLSSLGLRGLFSADTIPPLVDSGKEVDEGEYLSRRLEEGVPEGPAEIPKGEAIPLEYNLAGLKAISFDKGCYVGQEFIARTHHRGVIRKRIVPATFVKDTGEVVEEAVAPKSEIIDASSGKGVGRVTTSIGSRGLALLKLEAAFNNSSQLTVKNSDKVYVKVSRPRWWPIEWG